MLLYLTCCCSNFLKERHPYRPERSAAHFSSEADVKQVSSAFGARAVPKLVALLTNTELDDAERRESLTILLEKLTDQSEKLSAVSHGAISAITTGLDSTWPGDGETACLAAKVLASLALVLPGRTAINEASAIVSLTQLLSHADEPVRVAGATALKNIATFRDGVKMLVKNNKTIGILVDALFDNISDDSSTHGSCEVVSEIASLCNYLSKFRSGIEIGVSMSMVSKLVAVLDPAAAAIRPNGNCFSSRHHHCALCIY